MTRGAVWRLRNEVIRVSRLAGVTPADPVVVACSHGPDSLALADALVAVARALELGPVTVAYVDHGLRPDATPAEAAGVRAFAARHRDRGVDAVVLPVHVDRAAGRGLEDAARRARYRALRAEADRRGARWVFLGHTASDQAETVVDRLLRGAGVAGLSGMAPVRDGYVRPLLWVSRAEVEEYLEARGIEPSHDASNDDDRFLRNRLRHQVLPALRRENPALERALSRVADALREQDEVVCWAARELAGRGEAAPDAFSIPASALREAPAAAARRLLQDQARRLGSALGARHLDAILGLCRRAAGSRQVDLPGLAAVREYDRLVLARRRALEVPRPEVVAPPGPYQVRPWAPGDRMRHPRGGGRSRKLSDLFADHRVPRRLREGARVVVRATDGEIVWAEHLGPSVHGSV